MAQWKETLEPYVKVYEQVRGSVLNPSAGGELIIGCAFISDAGPSVPTLITSQSEFMKTYASKDITADYIGSLDNLYEGQDKTTASTMWMNAYRLAGSNTLLAVRACKASDLFVAKPLNSEKNPNDVYVSRDGALLKKVDPFNLVIDMSGDDATSRQFGWALNINGVGIFGNYTSDAGALYDYYVDNIVDLVEKLNETSVFFSPKYTFGKIENVTVDGENKITSTFIEVKDVTDKSAVNCVKFEEVYLGNNLIDTSDERVENGRFYVLFTDANGESILSNFNETTAFEPAEYYATNVFNSASDLKVRIRRFNHDAVTAKTLSDAEKKTLNETSASPWVPIKNVLDTFTNKGQSPVAQSVADRDFYEVAVMDPSVSEEVLFFNIGKIIGRGDMEASEVNNSLKMIQLVLPDNMADLGLNYYKYTEDDGMVPGFVLLRNKPEGTIINTDSLENIENPEDQKYYSVTTNIDGKTETKYYQYLVSEDHTQVYVDLTIKADGDDASAILNVSDTDLKKALDLIALDEIYVTEGLCDLGNTELSYQNYMANMAINENYFYPISTVNSSNYMTIANNASKISQDSYKLYMSAPWDIDSGTMGWKTYMSPSVLYWEAVARNRRNNEEFRGIIGQSGGIVQYQKPLAEFNKKTRQLLLSKRINTVLWNVQTSAWNMNDNYTKQSVENIMSDDGNSRLAIRISKAMPLLLRQFIGRKINALLWKDATSVINYWFRSTIMPMQYTVAEYLVIIDESNNPEELQRQNKMAVTVNVRYANTLKYITVYHNILELGMDITAL